MNDLDKEKERLLKLGKEKGTLHGEFTLTSGLKTTYYFDFRLVTLWPEGAYLVGKIIFKLIDGRVDVVGGMTIGADPIVTAVAVISYLEGRPIPAFIVRPEEKKHGAQKAIEGPIPKNARVAIVDDVLTTGGSLLRAAETVEKDGHRVVEMIVLLDRQQGGAENIQEKGYSVTSILTADKSGKIFIS